MSVTQPDVLGTLISQRGFFGGQTVSLGKALQRLIRHLTTVPRCVVVNIDVLPVNFFSYG
jgi:hypothetical protein